MSERAKILMQEIWHERNTWADSEEKLVAAILRKAIPHIKSFTASSLNDLTVLDKSDILTLSKEIENANTQN